MTTHPGAAEERPAEAGPVDLFGCSCAVSAVIKNVASAKERATISDSLMDERMEFLDDFDLLMENASHSKRIYGDTTALAANRSKESALQSWARLSGLRPTGGR